MVVVQKQMLQREMLCSLAGPAFYSESARHLHSPVRHCLRGDPGSWRVLVLLSSIPAQLPDLCRPSAQECRRACLVVNTSGSVPSLAISRVSIRSSLAMTPSLQAILCNSPYITTLVTFESYLAFEKSNTLQNGCSLFPAIIRVVICRIEKEF